MLRDKTLINVDKCFAINVDKKFISILSVFIGETIYREAFIGKAIYQFFATKIEQNL